MNRLLKHNININNFINFVEKGDIDTVKRLLNENRKLVFMVDDYGNTALHLAVLEESEQALAMVKLLLEHGADISKKNQAGYNPLDLVEDKSLEVFQLLQKQVQSSSHWRKTIALFAFFMLLSAATHAECRTTSWITSTFSFFASTRNYMSGFAALAIYPPLSFVSFKPSVQSLFFFQRKPVFIQNLLNDCVELFGHFFLLLPQFLAPALRHFTSAPLA